MFKTRSGTTKLSKVKNNSLSKCLNIEWKEKVRLKKIFRATILSRAASADNETLKTLSDRQLDDMDLSKATFVSEIVKSFRKDLDTSEDNISHR